MYMNQNIKVVVVVLLTMALANSVRIANQQRTISDAPITIVNKWSETEIMHETASPDTDTDAAPSPAQTHQLLMHQDVATLIQNTNSSDYKWIGNHWTAPPGIPTFTPRQLKSYFQKRNVLVIGDSTSRRFYYTLFALMTADDLDNVAVKELDAADVIDANKGNKVNLCPKEQGRAISDMGGRRWSVCRDMIAFGDDDSAAAAADAVSLSANDTTSLPADTAKNDTRTSTTSSRETVKFDHTIQYCYNNIDWLWRDEINEEEESSGNGNGTGTNAAPALNSNLQIFQKDYDLVIVAMGIWELAKSDVCDRANYQNVPNTTTVSRLEWMLESMQRNNPTDLQVVFRTSGFDTRHVNTDQKMWDANAVSKEFFHDLETKPGKGGRNANVTLVDWGGVLEKRSFGEDRIVGDHPAHYGLEARLLFIQQLMHELVKADLMKAT
jgi:hypothetical protein